MFIKFIVNIADYNSFSQQSTEYVAILYCYSLHAASRFWCHIFIIRFCLSLFFSFVFLKYYLIRINFLHATKHFKHLSNRELKETCLRTVNLTYCKISHIMFAVIALQLHQYKKVFILLNMLWNIFFPILGGSNCSFG